MTSNLSVLAVDLKDDAAVETYVRYHEAVWPEVLRSLRQAGILDMEIFLHGRRLVMVVDTGGVDVRRCFANHFASHPRVIEWEALMKTLQEQLPGAPPGDWWVRMRPVFRLGVVEDASGATESARR
jgi:L-rhamnose mutarotase